MKAFLLAAGLGTRLRPLTYELPKCMLPINGAPLLAIWLDLLQQHRISQVLINTHYLPESVERYLASARPSYGIHVFTSHEEELLGSAGTIRRHRGWVEGDHNFLVCYADNLTDADLSHLAASHRQDRDVLTMALFESDNPRGCGIATLDEDSTIVDFVEKPEKPASRWANAGIYVASRSFLDYIGEADADIGKDVLPRLVGKMRGTPVKGYLRDIGTMESYARAQLDWYRRRTSETR